MKAAIFSRPFVLVRRAVCGRWLFFRRALLIRTHRGGLVITTASTGWSYRLLCEDCDTCARIEALWRTPREEVDRG